MAMRPIFVKRCPIGAVHWHDLVMTAAADYTEAGVGPKRFANDEGNGSNSDGADGGN